MGLGETLAQLFRGEKMTVEELIAELEKIEDKKRRVFYFGEDGEETVHSVDTVSWVEKVEIKG